MFIISKGTGTYLVFYAHVKKKQNTKQKQKQKQKAKNMQSMF